MKHHNMCRAQRLTDNGASTVLSGALMRSILQRGGPRPQLHEGSYVGGVELVFIHTCK